MDMEKLKIAGLAREIEGIGQGGAHPHRKEL